MKRIVIPLLIIFVLLLGGLFGLIIYMLPALKPIISQSSLNIADIIEKNQQESRIKDINSGENKTQIPLNIPQGFDLDIFARDLGKVRDIINSPNGGLLASLMDQGKVVALPDIDQDGRSDRTFVVLEGLYNPHGLLLMCEEEDCQLYVAETNVVSVYDYNTKTLKAENRQEIIDLPDDGGHYTRTLMRVSYKGEEKILISVGSSCNVCEEEDERRSKILITDLDGKNLETFASGLRNSVFMATHPVTGEYWATDMGRDWLGDDLPPDEINIIQEGNDYGWPICYGKNIHDTNFDKNQYIRDPCEDKTSSYIDLGAHVAPLGIAFIPEEGWEEGYWYNALVALHGSWNRSQPAGYKVIRLILDAEGNYLGEEDFINGWLTDNNEALGRPVDILVRPGGELFISDDKAGVIYRLTSTGMVDQVSENYSPDIILEESLGQRMIDSPFTVKGEARGTWYFEGDFPVEILDANENLVARGIARALGDWMTEDYVKFTSELIFTPPATESGTIIFRKDNPSGLAQYDKEFSIPVRFRKTTQSAGEVCEVASDCSTPMEFMIRSSCPYQSECIAGKCTVVCPDF